MGKKYATLFISRPDVRDEDAIRKLYIKPNSSNEGFRAALESMYWPPEAKRLMLRQLALSEPFVLRSKTAIISQCMMRTAR